MRRRRASFRFCFEVPPQPAALKMSDATSILREIECASCAARFRVRGPAGQPLAQGVDCPLCGAPIALNRSAGAGFSRLSHASVFGHEEADVDDAPSPPKRRQDLEAAGGERPLRKYPGGQSVAPVAQADQ